MLRTFFGSLSIAKLLAFLSLLFLTLKAIFSWARELVGESIIYREKSSSMQRKTNMTCSSGDHFIVLGPSWLAGRHGTTDTTIHVTINRNIIQVSLVIYVHFIQGTNLQGPNTTPFASHPTIFMLFTPPYV